MNHLRFGVDRSDVEFAPSLGLDPRIAIEGAEAVLATGYRLGSLTRTEGARRQRPAREILLGTEWIGRQGAWWALTFVRTSQLRFEKVAEEFQVLIRGVLRDADHCGGTLALLPAGATRSAGTLDGSVRSDAVAARFTVIRWAASAAANQSRLRARASRLRQAVWRLHVAATALHCVEGFLHLVSTPETGPNDDMRHSCRPGLLAAFERGVAWGEQPPQALEANHENRLPAPILQHAGHAWRLTVIRSGDSPGRARP